MKHLPLYVLGFFINLIVFSIFAVNIKADECTGKNAGDSCGAFIRQIDANTCMPCHGSCVNSGGTLSCSVSGGNVGCSPSYTCSTISPSPTGSPAPTTAPPPTQTSGIIIGVQLPKGETVRRLLPSQYSFQWVKFQYSLGSDQPLENWISTARSTSSGGGHTYQVLISVAKNEAHIPELLNPPYPEQSNGHPAFTQKYCPWDDELDTYTEGTGEFHQCGTDALDNPEMCEDTREVTVPARAGNGYLEFRDAMQALAPRLNGASAVEIWNEPNLEDEWTAQGLGPVSPENYINFMDCGIKGLRKGGYNGTVISAGLAPNAYATATGQTNMNDLDFFNTFVAKGGLENIDAIGWHSNVTSNIAPSSTDDNGFQRFNHALGKGKPVWLTEFGWDRSTFHLANDFEDRQLQAQYIAQAYAVAKNMGGVVGTFVWNFGWTIDYPNQTAFAPWDIEGTTPRGLLCQPNPPRDPNAPRDRADTKYVQDTKVATYPYMVELANRALVPNAVVRDVDQKVLGVSETKVDVTKSFLSELLGIFDPLRNFLCSSWLGQLIDFGTFCTPNISIGKVESNPQGKNIQEYAAKAEILGKANIPAGMTLVPEAKDCNIGNIGTPDDPGDKKLNEISEFLGTAAGFFGNNIPDFKNIAPEEWQSLIDRRMKTENLNVGTKLFQQDKRDPEECLQLKNKMAGIFPPEIFSPNMTCDEVYALILEINRSRFP